MNVKGMRDFYGEELDKRRYISDMAKVVFESYGYSELDTPAVESEEILSRKAGEEIKGQLFRIEGDLALRFDLTVPLARYVANTSLPKPFKRYAIGKVWRREEPQKGRFREFLQADADIAGSSSMRCEAELIACACETLGYLGFGKLAVKVNDRGILNRLAEKFGIREAEKGKFYRALDKIGKAYGNAAEAVRAAGISNPELEEFYKRLEGGGNEKIIEAACELLGNETTNNIEKIIEFSKPYGTEKNIVVDLSLVRGLDYYTGPIFEIQSEEYKLSIAGGGRYDGLIGIYGKVNEPAVGISLGIERIADLIKAPKKKVKRAMVIGIGDVYAEAVAAARKLRANAICETDLMERNLSKQLQYANSRGFDFAIIIGEAEKKKGTVKIKDLKTGNEKEILMAKIADEF